MDPHLRRRWAESVIARRSWWIKQAAGDGVLMTAAHIMGEESVAAMEKYLQDHLPRDPDE